MTLTQVKKMKVGDVAKWPEGANGCAAAKGVVLSDPSNDALFVMWEDGQRTYLHDKNAVQYIERAA
jgi:hypothetical protein